MKKIILLLLISIPLPSYALDFNAYFDQIKTKFNELINPAKEVEAKPEVEMPEIPKVNQDAKSLDVYNKTGALYTQGALFNNLSTEKKRKYRLAFIQELYLVVTGSAGDKEKILSALNVIERGGSREGIYRSIVLSQEYSALEGFSETPSEDLVNFSAKYGEKFLHKVFNKDQMRKINLFGIKRVITEKSLELIDSFPKDNDDLHKWYAIFSADMRAKFPLLWTGKTRTQKSALYHLRWAKSVPLQQIKSEVIIKLHKIMNSLQK